MALPLFAVTLFVSAFFLFLVQPIVGKIILPKLGGTPQVWNTCMVFFQTALLVGYAYTHTVSTRLRPRQQLALHAALLFVPLIVIGLTVAAMHWNSPFYIQGWTPRNLGGNPIPDTLGWLLTRVGLPFFVVATSAPLLQKWFATTGHPSAKDPYFLYGASNLGSLLSLLLYPIAVEPWLGLTQQAWLFTGGYVLLVLLALCCAALVWAPAGKQTGYMEPVPAPEIPQADQFGTPASSPPAAPASAPPPTTAPATAFKKGPPRPGRPLAKEPDIARGSDEVTLWRRLRWVGLAAVPTSFMLGVTTHITTDLSPIPLFWLVPLSLYLLTFILVYSRWPVVWVEGPHQAAVMLQPIAVAAMVFVEIWGLSSSKIWVAVFCNVLAFFLTALVCHGELAKDRPSTRHLTEYYLMMSLGGMLGGVFNGLLAPILFVRVIEFNIAIFVACLLRPTLKDEGWVDKYVANTLEPPAQPVRQQKKGVRDVQVNTEGPTNYAAVLDFVLPLAVLLLLGLLVFVLGGQMARLASYFVSQNEEEGQNGMRLFLSYGIPLVIACFFYARPIRFGLAIGAVLLVHSIYMSRVDSSIYADRSYFGIIRVQRKPSDQVPYEYNQLIHGHINHGMNFRLAKEEDRGKPDKDYSRLATTYYHRYGPAGVVMEKFNWFSQGPYLFTAPQNNYWGDARMPSSLLALTGADALGGSGFPAGALVGLWSEPPFATIGLGTGTMASYCRPFQHCHYYEIDNHIRRLSLPSDGSDPFFTYLQQARKRGGEVQVLMGDARLRMALPYKNHHDKENRGFERGGGPDNFYHMMVVDAFSSDAIPVHLITKEALQLYFTKLTEDGILCVHTSNRFVDLPKVVAAVTRSLGPDFAYLRAHDDAPYKQVGHFTSEWVMVARKAEYLKGCVAPPRYRQAFESNPKNKNRVFEDYWQLYPPAESRYLWTDDHSNLVSVLR